MPESCKKVNNFCKKLFNRERKTDSERQSVAYRLEITLPASWEYKTVALNCKLRHNFSYRFELRDRGWTVTLLVWFLAEKNENPAVPH